jgi:sugar-specific transcriptional regulator TrmB
MKYANQLQELGWSAHEAQVYLASLRVGNARVSRIAEEAGLPKSTTQDTLATLHEKGLVSRYKHKNCFYFSPSDPSVISMWMDRKKTVFEDLLPKLHSLQLSADDQPTVRSYFDKSGFSTIEREILSEAKEVLLITPAHNLDEILPDYFPGFMTRRVKHRIHARILIEKSPIAEKVKTFDKIAQHETRTIKPPLPFDSLLLMWGKKIAAVSLDCTVTIVVLEDKHISQMLNSLFELLWSSVSRK